MYAAKAHCPRSIPACAGEPSRPASPGCAPSVYPRVCGGTTRIYPCTHAVPGLSPRVRGNPGRRVLSVLPARSIPACAGEPPLRDRCSTPSKVYPRVCGGTSAEERARLLAVGLSPRVRGNPTGGTTVVVGGGSIPACAGEPGASLSADSSCKGLSPRVRGNLPTGNLQWLLSGSIPACAGEPSQTTVMGTAFAVYPRVCGGTVYVCAAFCVYLGLSPRVRGNRRRPYTRARRPRSIPACAGEPRSGCHAVP